MQAARAPGQPAAAASLRRRPSTAAQPHAAPAPHTGSPPGLAARGARPPPLPPPQTAWPCPPAPAPRAPAPRATQTPPPPAPAGSRRVHSDLRARPWGQRLHSGSGCSPASGLRAACAQPATRCAHRVLLQRVQQAHHAGRHHGLAVAQQRGQDLLLSLRQPPHGHGVARPAEHLLDHLRQRGGGAARGGAGAARSTWRGPARKQPCRVRIPLQHAPLDSMPAK